MSISKERHSDKMLRSVAVIALLTGFIPTAGADVTYIYTGKNFTTFQNGDACDTVTMVGECRIQFSFTVQNPLPANVTSVVELVPFSFTDGVVTFSNPFGSGANSSDLTSFRISTDQNGVITGWDIHADGEDADDYLQTDTAEDL